MLSLLAKASATGTLSIADDHNLYDVSIGRHRNLQVVTVRGTLEGHRDMETSDP